MDEREQISILTRCLDQAYNILRREYYEMRPNYNYYPFIPMHSRAALEELIIAQDHFTKLGMDIRALRFLDVGCGLGNIMEIAGGIGFQSFGIEYNEGLIHKALFTTFKMDKKVLKNEMEGVFFGDAFKFNFYDQFNVIYLYRPVRDPVLEGKLEQLIENEMAVGTIYIANDKIKPIEKSSKFKVLLRGKRLPMWIKVKNS